MSDEFNVKFSGGLKVINLEFLKEKVPLNSEVNLYGEFSENKKLFPIKVIAIHENENNNLCLSFSLPMIDSPVARILLYFCDKEGQNNKLILFDNLFPSNDSEFNKQFIRKVQRTKYPQLDYYIAHQIVSFFKGSSCYLCCSAVVKAYKAVEIGGRDLLTDALSSLDQAVNLSLGIDEDWHPRRNGIHLYFSLLCARWHLCLALNDRDEFLKTLNSVLVKSKELQNFSFHTAGYPISLSVAVKVLYDSFVENKDVWDESDFCSWVFKKTVQDANPRKITLFDELKVSHNSALVCMKVASKQVDFKDDAALKNIFFTLLRVKGKAADRLLFNFLKMKSY